MFAETLYVFYETLRTLESRDCLQLKEAEVWYKIYIAHDLELFIYRI